jgi:DNA-binding CsgD family transcriptional regulator
MIFKKDDIARRQHAIGVAKQLYGQGYTTREVAAKMCLSESQVRSLKKTIDESDNAKRD